MTTRYEQLKALVLAGAEHQLGEEHWRKVLANLEAAEVGTADKLRRVAAECRDAGEPEDREMGEALAKVFEIAADIEAGHNPFSDLVPAVIEAGELMYEQILEAEK